MIAYLALFDSALRCRNRQMTQACLWSKIHAAWKLTGAATGNREIKPSETSPKNTCRRPLKQQRSEVRFSLRSFNQRAAWILYSCSSFTTINTISSSGHAVRNISKTLPGYTQKKCQMYILHKWRIYWRERCLKKKSKDKITQRGLYKFFIASHS